MDRRHGQLERQKWKSWRHFKCGYGQDRPRSAERIIKQRGCVATGTRGEVNDQENKEEANGPDWPHTTKVHS